MQNQIRYQQLQPEDGVTIASMHQRGCSVRAMARTLQRSASTASRELNRNTPTGAGDYGSHVAQLACTAASVPPVRLPASYSPCLTGRVSPTDCSYPEAHLPQRTCPPLVPRNYLHRDLRFAQRRTTPPARSMREPGARHPATTLSRCRSARSDPRDGQYPCPPARDRGPRYARALGGRLHQGCG
jgi:hypothetical protein